MLTFSFEENNHGYGVLFKVLSLDFTNDVEFMLFFLWTCAENEIK